MIATTPSGTRTRRMRSPLGRTQPSTTSPTGSGSAATCRRPSAMASTRRASSRKRSTTVAGVPAASARSTSSALARSTSSVRSTRRSAAARRASSLAAVDAPASTRAAALAWRPSSASGVVDMACKCTDHRSRQTWPPVDHSLLAEPVQRFVDELTPELERLATSVDAAAGKARQDVTLEAFNIAAGFVDSDGLHTDEELLALVAVFGGLLDTGLASATPGDLRRAGLVRDKAEWIGELSPLFEVLVADDSRHGTKVSWRYYELALDIAHAACSLDTHPSFRELATIDTYRTMLLGGMQRAQVGRPGSGHAPAVEAAPEEPPRPLEELLAELDELVGLAAVKAEVKLVADLLTVQKLRKERGLPVVESSRHLVFTGNPGTGKTTVARLVAQVYRTLGVVEKGHLVETHRSHLVAGFVGQTATRTRECVERALGGVLLIDEAYALAQGGDEAFGQEAVATLVKLMEDHRHALVVIVAGYPEEMHELIESNPGLR